MPILHKIKFYKYHGAGNDFILIEDFAQNFPINQIAALCQRRFGIGADGLILAQTSKNADFCMRYFNCDGSSSSMCGNGLRCFVQFLSDLGYDQSSYSIEIDGTISSVTKMGLQITTFLEKPGALDEALQFGPWRGHAVNTGTEHLVIFSEGEVDVNAQGKKIRNHELFSPGGINVNFAQILNKEEILIRTYERGVEAETMACGSGAAAVAFVGKELGLCQSNVKVQTRGGSKLEVNILDEIAVTGPTCRVFEGEVSL